MKKEKSRLADLATRLRASEVLPRSDIGKKDIGKTDIGNIDPNPPHGDKRDFRKVTITLPQAVYELLAQESFRRKVERRPNHLLSAIIREAIVSFFKQKDLR